MKHNLVWKQQFLDGAELLDAYRVFPRIFIGLYITGLTHILNWATSLPDISIQQAGFISVISGTFPFMLNFYMQTGREWQKEKQREDVRYVTVDNTFVGEDAGVRSGGDSGGGAIHSPVPLRPKVQHSQNRTIGAAQKIRRSNPEE